MLFGAVDFLNKHSRLFAQRLVSLAPTAQMHLSPIMCASVDRCKDVMPSELHRLSEGEGAVVTERRCQSSAMNRSGSEQPGNDIHAKRTVLSNNKVDVTLT